MRNVSVLIFASILAAAGPSSGIAMNGGDRPVSSDGARSDGAIQEGVTGRVTSASGAPIEGVFVQAKSLDRPLAAIPDIAIFTNNRGRFTWRLRPGTYELSVLIDGRRTAAKTATVRPGSLTKLDFRLDAQR